MWVILVILSRVNLYSRVVRPKFAEAFRLPWSRTGESGAELGPGEQLEHTLTHSLQALSFAMCACPTMELESGQWIHLCSRPEKNPASYGIGTAPRISSNRIMLQQVSSALVWNLSLRLKTRNSHLYKSFGFPLGKDCISILYNPIAITEWQNFDLVLVLLVLIKGMSLPRFSS